MNNAEITPLTIDDFVDKPEDEYEMGIIRFGDGINGVIRITDWERAQIIEESGDSVKASSYQGIDIDEVNHPCLGKLVLVSTVTGSGGGLMIRR